MQLDIRGRSLPLTPALDAYVERRMRFALGRFEPRMRRVTVRVGDENGPRGGVDNAAARWFPLRSGPSWSRRRTATSMRRSTAHPIGWLTTF